jgi:hypothetical protein
MMHSQLQQYKLLSWTVSRREGRHDAQQSATTLWVVRTFSLSHDRKTNFAVLGRGHLGVLGGGSRGLSCSGHTLGW